MRLNELGDSKECDGSIFGMTRLNHNRPSLRYIDNLRRELSREGRSATIGASAGQHHAPPFGTRRAKLLQTFSTLNASQRNAIEVLFMRVSELMEAEHDHLSAMLAKRGKLAKKRAARDQASDALAEAAARLIHQVTLERAAGRDTVWSWYKSFYSGLNRQEHFHWAGISQFIMEDGLMTYKRMLEAPDSVEAFELTAALKQLT